MKEKVYWPLLTRIFFYAADFIYLMNSKLENEKLIKLSLWLMQKSINYDPDCEFWDKSKKQ